MNLQLPVIESKQAKSLHEFIIYWSQLYFYANESLYSKNINLSVLTKEKLTDLFNWKNGMTLIGSGRKEKSLNEKILNRIELINQYKSELQIDIFRFNADFGNISAVWRIFLLHILNPLKYPIYDQHIHRSYNYLTGLRWNNISNKLKDKDKIDFYFNSYIPFVNNAEIKDLKRMDEAFFAFGQFLNTRVYCKLI